MNETHFLHAMYFNCCSSIIQQVYCNFSSEININVKGILLYFCFVMTAQFHNKYILQCSSVNGTDFRMLQVFNAANYKNKKNNKKNFGVDAFERAFTFTFTIGNSFYFQVNFSDRVENRNLRTVLYQQQCRTSIYQRKNYTEISPFSNQKVWTKMVNNLIMFHSRQNFGLSLERGEF